MMTESQFGRARQLRIEIAKMEQFIYAIDKETTGTLGHTGICEMMFKKVTKSIFFSLISTRQGSSYMIDIPESIALEIGDISKRELEKLKKELADL